MEVHYDSQEQIMEFLVPSHSRGKRVYGLELDMQTAEIGCGCEALSEFREASNMPYRRDAAGTMLEQLAAAKGKRLLPLITRPPRALCPHAKKVRLWVLRQGLMPYFNARESRLVERLEGISA
jgi:hypothetical protein